jgi:hypothetical protein
LNKNGGKMKKIIITLFIMTLSFIISCSVINKYTGVADCTGELDIAAQTFENYKYKAQNIGSLVSNAGLLKGLNQTINKNMSTVTGWIADVPRLDKVHYEATKYFVSSNSNFLKAVDNKDVLDKLQNEINNLSKTATEDEKQAKYLELLNDPKVKEKMDEYASKTNSISAEKKGYLDKAYVHITYGLIFDAATAGISSLIVTEGKSQVESIKSSVSNPIEAARKSKCLLGTVNHAADITSQAKNQIGVGTSIYNAICKIYAGNGYELPKVANASGKPIESDLP